MSKRLDGWKIIAAWLKLSTRQCKKLASERTPLHKRLPVFRLADGAGSRVSADADELDAWVQRMRDHTSNVRGTQGHG